MSERIYMRDGKPVFHASNLVNYFTCPKSYELSTIVPQTEMTAPQRDGLLYEMYLFFNLEKYDDDKIKALEGRKKAETLNEIRKQADKMMQVAEFKGGKSFVDLSADFGDYIIEGEADYIGTSMYRGKYVEAIQDVKTTSDAYRLWMGKRTAYDYLQSIIYPMTYFKMTGVALPFIYYIHDLPLDIIKTVKVSSTQEDFEAMHKKLSAIAQEIKAGSLKANACYENCVYNKFRTNCKFLPYCSEGVDIFAPDEEISYGLLEL